MLAQGQGLGLTSYRVGTKKLLTAMAQGTLESVQWQGVWLPFSGPLPPALQAAPRAPAGQPEGRGLPPGATSSGLSARAQAAVPVEGLLPSHLELSPEQELAPTAGPSQPWSGDLGAD